MISIDKIKYKLPPLLYYLSCSLNLYSDHPSATKILSSDFSRKPYNDHNPSNRSGLRPPTVHI